MLRNALVVALTLCCGLIGCAAAQNPPATITVQVDKPGHAIPTSLWGIFFEDINLSLDGGVYAELVRNRSFEDSDKPGHWSLVPRGDAKGTMQVTSETSAAADPLKTRNRRSLKVSVEKASAESPLGVANEGYFGMSLKEGDNYLLSFSAMGAEALGGKLLVSLESADGAKVYAKESIEGVGAEWKAFKATLKSTATDPKARLVIAASGAGTLYLDRVSLFPEKTWKNHGWRPDLMEMLAGLKPAFNRFPGGCWVEGDTMREAYRWKETVGDPFERRTQWNIWGYWATHGVGYHEYLQMCEDLNTDALFVVNCGMSHKENVPMDQMGPMVQDALDAVEYAIGPVTSKWGALRAKNGHPEPFKLKYVEIGNENGGPAYQERYALMYKAIKEKYPQLVLIANDWGGVPKNVPIEVVDEHYYNTPDFFIQQAHKYDKYDRKGHKVYVGEYAVTRNGGQGNLRAAVGEAAFMLGMERNSDVVIMASYAPLFVHMNHRKWNPDLINFDSSRVYGIPSYYVQKMFAQNRGDVLLPTTMESPEAQAAPAGGMVGVGTWLTQAEYKDIKVTRGDTVLYQFDPAKGTQGMKLEGGGDWKIVDGALRQNSNGENIRAVFGDRNWTDYTLTLKARKIAGAEGFLILAAVGDANEKSWWNLGGWGNKQHGIEMGSVAEQRVNGRIETGRWYDIKVELQGRNIKCYLDGKLVHDAATGASKSIFASASLDKASNEVIVKVVNASAEPIETTINLSGIAKLAPQAKAWVLASEKPTDENSLENPTKVAPQEKSIATSGNTIKWSFPGNSVTVIRVKGQ